MALFYKAKEGDRVVKAEATPDSKKIVVEEANGKVSEVSPLSFAAEFDLVDQAAGAAAFVVPAPAPVVADKGKKKDEATV